MLSLLTVIMLVENILMTDNSFLGHHGRIEKAWFLVEVCLQFVVGHPWLELQMCNWWQLHSAHKVSLGCQSQHHVRLLCLQFIFNLFLIFLSSVVYIWAGVSLSRTNDTWDFKCARFMPLLKSIWYWYYICIYIYVNIIKTWLLVTSMTTLHHYISFLSFHLHSTFSRCNSFGVGYSYDMFSIIQHCAFQSLIFFYPLFFSWN